MIQWHTNLLVVISTVSAFRLNDIDRILEKDRGYFLRENKTRNGLKKDYPQPLQYCEMDDVIQNECIKCVCKTEKYYDCITLTNCSDKNSDDLNKYLKPGALACRPNMIYVHQTATCICTNEGNWPHDQCKNIFKSLPPENTKKESCNPETYVTIDCNVCYCNDQGKIDSNRCTRNICDVEINTKGRRSGTSNVYGNCEVQYWYSLAPCQFCYCVRQNKLVCNPGYNYEHLQLGLYNLSICGKNFIKEILELVPNTKGLRYGGFNQTIPTERTTKTTTNIPSIHGDSININREQKELKDMENYDSDTEEDVEQSDKIETITLKSVGRKGTTRMPYDDDEIDTNVGNDFTYDVKEQTDDDFESDTELEVPVEQPSVPTKDRPLKLDNTNSESSADSLQTLRESLQNTVTWNLTNMIGNVLKIGFRKAMMVVDRPCEPGSVKVIDECNVCFCMKNNRTLCTNDKCNL